MLAAGLGAPSRRRTSSIVMFGPATAPREDAEVLAARDEDLELDALGVAALAGREERDDLAVRARLRLQVVERGVDRRELELHAHPVEREPGLEVRAEPMLLVLGEDAEEPGVELVLRDDAAAAAALLLRDLTERGEERLHLRRGLGRVALRGREDAPVELDGLEEQIEDLRRELDAPEAQVVEQVLELVREAAHHRGAEEAGEALQRVHGAEDVVDELGVAAAAPADVVEREEIAAQAVDDLLRLGEELLARLVARALAASAAARVLSHRLAGCAALAGSRVEEARRTSRAASSGVNGFGT